MSVTKNFLRFSFIFAVALIFAGGTASAAGSNSIERIRDCVLAHQKYLGDGVYSVTSETFDPESGKVMWEEKLILNLATGFFRYESELHSESPSLYFAIQTTPDGFCYSVNKDSDEWSIFAGNPEQHLKRAALLASFAHIQTDRELGGYVKAAAEQISDLDQSTDEGKQTATRVGREIARRMSLMDGLKEFKISIPDGHASYFVESSGLINRVDFVINDHVVQSITTLPEKWKEIGRCSDSPQPMLKFDAEPRYGMIISQVNAKYIVTKVFSGPAHDAGVEVGMQLLSVSEIPVANLSVNELRDLLSSSQSAFFTFLSPETNKEIQLQIQKQ